MMFSFLVIRKLYTRSLNCACGKTIVVLSAGISLIIVSQVLSAVISLIIVSRGGIVSPLNKTKCQGYERGSNIVSHKHT